MESLPDPRLVPPVFPILLAGLVFELRTVIDKLRQAMAGTVLSEKLLAMSGSAAILAGAGLCLYTTCSTTYRELPEFIGQYRRFTTSNRQAYAWISVGLPAEARFFAYDDPVLYLYTGRRACSQPEPTRLFYRDQIREAQDLPN